MLDHIVKFRERQCSVLKREYSSGRIALRLVDPVNGEPIATGTVNIPSIDIHEGEGDHTLIKNYYENQGMVQALVDGGIIEPPIRDVEYGHAVMWVAKVLI